MCIRDSYSVEVPSLRCDHFSLTPTQGEGTGESFCQFPIKPGDLILADRGYCAANGIAYVDANDAFVTVRLNPQHVPLLGPSGRPFELLPRLKRFTQTGEIRVWPVWIPTDETHSVAGRVCAVRKTQEAIRQAHKKLRQRAIRKGHKLRPQTLVYAEYVLVFTTFPEADFSAAVVLEWYRIRWQIELVFKRFKQIAQLGHLPKHDDESAQAWLYGKLFIALITDKLIRHAKSFSPWGYEMDTPPAPESVA